jgi:thymidylate kinase
MKKCGRLIVFEGPDGSGKTTLSRALAEHLALRGVDSEHFSFPGQDDGTLGKLVHNLHHNPQLVGVETIVPASLQLMHIAAHIDTIQSRILPSLRKDKVVILDRFWWSTWVYGKVNGVNNQILASIIKAEHLAWEEIVPHAVFLLIRDETDSTEVSKKLSDEYEKLAVNESQTLRVSQIVNKGSIDETLAEIVSDLRILEEASTQNGPIEHPVEGGSNELLVGPKTSLGSHEWHSSTLPAKSTEVFDTYWRFAVKRQDVFFRRWAGDAPPWTDDPILSEYKFTNVYRASDRVSQYLIRHVIYEGDQSPNEIFFRVLLFKLFNRIETWQLLEREFQVLSFADYSFTRYNSLLERAINNGRPIYSAAYIMPSGGSSTVGRKHRMHLELLERMMRDDLPSRIAEARSMGIAFDLLRSYPTIGDFLAYQYITDLNYSTLTNFSEMEFVVPGPGARDGIRKCFNDLGGLNEGEIIKVVAERQEIEFERLGLKFQSLWGRRLQLIDCQNLFCEVDKYARIFHPDVEGITGRTRIKQRYRVNPDPISVWYPPKWGLNEQIADNKNNVSSI